MVSINLFAITTLIAKQKKQVVISLVAGSFVIIVSWVLQLTVFDHCQIDRTHIITAVSFGLLFITIMIAAYLILASRFSLDEYIEAK